MRIINRESNILFLGNEGFSDGTALVYIYGPPCPLLITFESICLVFPKLDISQGSID